MEDRRDRGDTLSESTTGACAASAADFDSGIYNRTRISDLSPPEIAASVNELHEVGLGAGWGYVSLAALRQRQSTT